MDLRMCVLKFSRKFWCPGILGLVETDNTITKKKKTLSNLIKFINDNDMV